MPDQEYWDSVVADYGIESETVKRLFDALLKRSYDGGIPEEDWLLSLARAECRISELEAALESTDPNHPLLG